MALGPYLTAKEAAELIGVGVSRVHQFVMQKRLSRTLIGSMVFFKRTEVERFARQQRPTGRPRISQKNVRRGIDKG